MDISTIIIITFNAIIGGLILFVAMGAVWDFVVGLFSLAPIDDDVEYQCGLLVGDRRTSTRI
tara:strand:+ start:270 stop:455 length:186 start_codon:yes stop_codon:yes gene_type:complete